MSDLILSAPLIFVLSLAFSALMYLIGSAVSPKDGGASGKLASYACGEDLPEGKLQMNVGNLFLYVTFFMVFEASAFILATSFGSQGLYPVLFIAVISLAVVTLLPVWRGE